VSKFGRGCGDGWRSAAQDGVLCLRGAGRASRSGLKEVDGGAQWQLVLPCVEGSVLEQGGRRFSVL
jgi:hypothetical protein